MEEMRSVPLFKSFKIIWEEGKNSPIRVKETMIITNNAVSFIRTSINDFDPDDLNLNVRCKWHFKTNDIEFETALNKVCLYFLNHMEPCEVGEMTEYSMFTIEVLRFNEKESVRKTFKGHLRDYDYEGLLDIIEGFIPTHCFMPYFIEDYPNN